MIKKYVSFTLVCLLLISANFSLVSAQTDTDKTSKSIAKIKAKVLAFDTGEKKRVEVKMSDGTKLKGYISQAGEDSFTLTDFKTNQNTVIAFRDVKKVNNSWSTGNKIALAIVGGAAATAAIVLGSFIFIRCRNEGGC